MSDRESTFEAIASKHLTSWPLGPQTILVTCHDNLTPDVSPYDLAQEFKAVYNAQLKEQWKLSAPNAERHVERFKETVQKELA